MLAVIKYEDLRDIVLIGHSYGGMVATAVADRARGRIAQLIYLDAFVPRDGQALADLIPPEQWRRMLERVKAGDGCRVPPNPIPPDTSEADLKWIAERRLPQSIKCAEMPLRLRNLRCRAATCVARASAPGDIFRPLPFAGPATVQPGSPDIPMLRAGHFGNENLCERHRLAQGTRGERPRF